MESEWLSALAALKSKDPQIYDKNVRYARAEADSDGKQLILFCMLTAFCSFTLIVELMLNDLFVYVESVEEQPPAKKAKVKPMYPKDFERKIILEREGCVTLLVEWIEILI